MLLLVVFIYSSNQIWIEKPKIKRIEKSKYFVSNQFKPNLYINIFFKSKVIVIKSVCKLD